MIVTQLWKISRPKQWTKNLFVFGALIFGSRLFDTHSIRAAFLTFVAFSLMSSAIYVLNDAVDRKQDRLHPQKRHRPLAAGTVSLGSAIVYGIFLFAIALVIAAMTHMAVLVTLSVYAVQNIAYSFWLKHVVLIDVFVIASGFVLRVIAGAVALPVTPSPWLLLCTFLLALFLGLSKRRAELNVLAADAQGHRKILDDYDGKLVDQLIILVAALVIMAYSLYAMKSPQGARMILTIPFVIYALFRYLYLIYKDNQGGEPANILVGDMSFLVSTLLWVIISFVIIYFPNDVRFLPK